jgi:hypothetical protein
MVLVTAACATASPDPSAILLSNTPPPDGRLCHAATTPATLPGVDALVDSAALIQRVRAGAGERPAYVLLSLRFDENGHPTWVRAIEGNLDSRRAVTIMHVVAEALRSPPAVFGGSVRLRIGVDTTPRVQVGRSEVCPAVPLGTFDITTRQVVRTTSGRPPTSEPPPPSTPVFSILVDTTGRLLDIKLKQSSGDIDVDRQFQQGLEKGRLLPTLLDRKPVVAWTVWPSRRD